METGILAVMALAALLLSALLVCLRYPRMPKRWLKALRRMLAELASSLAHLRRSPGSPPRRQVLTSPEEVTRHVIEHFDEVSERDIGAADYEVLKASPLSVERCLLYALRVSRMVPAIKTFKTLVSRWTVANCGAGGTGLQVARSAENWALVHGFLSRLYLRQFNHLCSAAVEEARETAAKRKTPRAKQNALKRATEKIEWAQSAFLYQLPGVEDVTAMWLDQLAHTNV